VTLDLWLAKHPYLEPIARLDGQIEREIDGIPLSTAGIPGWDRYFADYVAGVPVLESEAVAIDLAPVEKALTLVVRKLASRPLPGALWKDAEALELELRSAAEVLPPFPARSHVKSPASPGLRRYLSWRLLSRYLGPVVNAFGTWRQEERWLRHYCPVCGSPPSMAQLIGVDPGSLRLLACGCCGNRWRYRRTGCPFCRNEDDHRIAVIAVEDQGGLRIDYCERCRGYLKTYQGQGSETVFLADWTSIQLDIIALDRGLKKVAASAYEM
jgi:FdhE protein